LRTLRPALLVAMLGLTALASCAYYNIFWMAKSEFDEASESGHFDFWDPYEQVPLKGDTERLVDSTIERCGKLLLLYPKSRWVDDALLLMGSCFTLKGEYANALRKYDELLSLYGSSEFAPMARYLKAYTLILDGSVPQAVTLLETIEAETRDKDVRQRAVYLLGRVAQERGNCSRATDFYEVYLTDFPKGGRVNKARLHLAGCLLKLDMPDRVISVLEPLAGKHTPEGYQAVLGLGEAYRAMGENDSALELLGHLREEASEDSIKARAMLETAKTLVARGEAEEAVKVLDEATEIATTQMGLLHDEIIYTQGVFYEKNLDDFKGAIASYDKVAKSRSDYGMMAQTRSDALKDVERYTAALADSAGLSAEDEARDRFMLGETYLEDLDHTEEAFRQFKTVADSFPGTEFGPPAMLRTAALLEAEGDTLGRTYLRRVIELYPETVQANLARSRLGLPLINVEIARPAAEEQEDFIGPPAPAAGADSLASVAPEIPGPPAPLEAPPDTLGRGMRPPQEEARRHPSTPPGELPGFPPRQPRGPAGPDTAAADTSASGAPVDSAATSAPGDTTRQEGRPGP
jgi:TolA-binding protein